ncbi:Transglutaminase-like superfamily protein [Durusdinium trenchii]|uniref:Transglutaminase-like superfamily protein n=1 Tax=Durusdinium trenchii TaxID=1381693 RepID=A0ABP0IH93_9DINO
MSSRRDAIVLVKKFAPGPLAAMPQQMINPLQPRRMRVVSLVLVFCGACVIVESGSPASADDAAVSKPTNDVVLRDDWYIVRMQEQRVGYSHVVETVRMVNDEPHYIVDSTFQMSLSRFGQRLKARMTLLTEEDAAGRLVRYTATSSNPPASQVTSTGVVQGEMLHITSHAGDSKTQKNSVGESVSFEVFEPQLGQVTTLTAKRLEDERREVWNGATKELTHVVMTQSLLPGLEEHLYLDEQMTPVVTSSSVLRMETFRVDRKEALKELPAADLDIAVETLIRVEPIERPHETKRVVYRVEVEGGWPADAVLEGGRQTLKRLDATTAELTVRRISPHDAAWGDESVQRLAKQGVGEARTPVERALALEKFVHSVIDEKNFSTAMATASEVARSREGDCTEHAVLLAALLRASGIPSRVAIGLVYIPNGPAFGGHMWTEAYLGSTWVPLDATLGRGGVGAAHIKLSDSRGGGVAEESSTIPNPYVRAVGLLRRWYGDESRWLVRWDERLQAGRFIEAERLEDESFRESLDRELGWVLRLGRKQDYIVSSVPRLHFQRDYEVCGVEGPLQVVVEFYVVELYGQGGRSTVVDGWTESVVEFE